MVHQLKTSAYYFHLDWIRAAAILLGIPFHVGLMYSVGHEWFITSPEKSYIITWITGVFTSFRMPLFFMMAGFFSALILARRERGTWLKSRLIRLGIPLLTAMLTISPFVMLVIADLQTRGEGGGDYWKAFWQLLTTPGNQWIGHLWFLIVLIEFSVLAYLLQPHVESIKAFLRPWTHNDDSSISLSAILVCCVVASLCTVGVEGAFYLLDKVSPLGSGVASAFKLEVFFQFLPYFLIGIFLYREEVPHLYTNKLVLLILAVAVVIFVNVWNETSLVNKLAKYLSRPVIAILLSFCIISLAERFTSTYNPITQRIVDASFTIYLVHYPICVALGLLLINNGVNIYAAYIFNIVATIAISLAIHAIISRSKWTRFLFNGTMKEAGQPSSSPAARAHTSSEVFPSSKREA